MKLFEDPKMEMIKLDVEDVVATSSPSVTEPDEGPEDELE